MGKREFLAKLEEALLENMDIEQAAKHIRYYREYIESEIEKGYSEEAVVATLQSPRLVAKNIIDNSDSVNKYDNNIKDYSSGYTHSGDKYSDSSNRNESFRGFTFSVNGKPVNSFWVKLIGILALIIVAALVVTVIGGIVWILFRFVLPVVLIIALVSFIIGIFTNNKR